MPHCFAVGIYKIKWQELKSEEEGYRYLPDIFC